jgi:TRAP transporter TAXI family solute receptor
MLKLKKFSVKFLLMGTAAAVMISGGALVSAPNIADAHVTFMGGQTKGAFNRVVNGWAAMVTKQIPGVTGSAKASAGSNANIRAVQAGKAELALAFASDLHDGAKGIGVFKKPTDNVRYVTFVFGSVGHFVVKAGSPIKRLADIKGKTISMGGPGSGSAKNLRKILEHVGLWGSFKDVYAGKKSSDQLVNGKVAAYNWHPGVGSGMIRGTANATKIRLIDMDVEASSSGFYKKYPYFEQVTIPAGVYPGVDAPVKTFGTGALLVAHKSVSADVVYSILKTAYSAEGRKFLTAAIGGRVKQMTVANGNKNLVAKLHPGAAKFWKEMGKKVM